MTTYDHPMVRCRPRPLMLLVALIALAGCGGSATVLDVNGETLDRGELDDLVADRLAPEGPTVPSAAVAQLLTRQVVLVVTDQELERQGLEVTDAEVRAEYDRLIEVNGAEGAPAFEDVAEDVYLQIAVRLAFQTEQALIDAVSDADVDLDPRYGTWSGVQAGVVPPGSGGS